MLKKLLFSLLFLTAILRADASHLMGGQVTCELQGGLTYEIKATIYRDTLGIPIATTDQLYVYRLSTGWNAVYSVTASAPNYIGNGVEEYTYSVVTSLPDTGDYVMAFYNCCRNASILNIPNPSSFSMYLHCNLHVDTTSANSSPVFLNPPIPVAQVNQPYIHNPLPFDADGDSLVWAFDLPMENGNGQNPFSASAIPGYTPIPSDISMPLTMDPATGEISFQPTVVGNFELSVVCHEYRNGVYLGKIRRDIQIIVVPSANIPPSNMPTSNHAPIAPFTYTVNPGSYYNFVLNSSDSNGQQLDIISNGEPLLLSNNPATYSHTSGIGSATGTFEWTPDASQARSAPYHVAFSIQDHWGPFIFTNDLTITLFIEPLATGLTNEISAGEEPKVYPNPADNRFTLELYSGQQEEITVQLMNILGQPTSFCRKQQVVEGKNIIIFDALTLESGMYFVKIAGSDGHKQYPIQTIQIIK